MSTRVGTGIRKLNNNAEIELLKREISTLRNENEILTIEKADLEKLPEELSQKVKELTAQVDALIIEKTSLENQVKELTETKETKKSKKDEEKASE